MNGQMLRVQYGIVAWTLKVSSLKLLQRFKMWTFRRMRKIPSSAHMRSEKVLQRIGTDRELTEIIKIQKLYIWDTCTKHKNKLLQLLIQANFLDEKYSRVDRFGISDVDKKGQRQKILYTDTIANLH